MSEAITHYTCLHCSKWQPLSTAPWTTSPLGELQLLAASLGQSKAPVSLHVAPFERPSLATDQKMFCCFDLLNGTTITWVGFFFRASAESQPPSRYHSAILAWHHPEPGWDTNCTVPPPLAKSLGHRAGLEKALAGPGIIQLGCVFLVEGPLLWCIRIFKEWERGLELDLCFYGKSVERAAPVCPVQ